MSAEHLTFTQRDALMKAAANESVGGIQPPFIAIVHKDLEDLGFVEIHGEKNPRVRCTPEGLEAAREIREQSEAA